MIQAFLLAALAVSAGAGEWRAAGSSIVLYTSTDSVGQEIGLGQWDSDLDSGTIVRNATRGGIGPDRALAWSFETVDHVPKSRPRSPGERVSRTLEFLGLEGQVLWQDLDADAPPGIDPVTFSAPFESAIVRERRDDRWTVAIYRFTGLRAAELAGDGALEDVTLDPGGRYLLGRWRVSEQQPNYAAHDLKTKKQKSYLDKDNKVPLRIDEQGRVYAAQKLVFSLD